MKSSDQQGGRRRKMPHGNGKGPKYVLRLYISGVTPRSSRAIINLKALCKKHLAGRFSLDVIDIYQQPELAREQQIVAAPTLIKTLPLPLRRFIGDMSRLDRVLVGLGLEPVAGELSEEADNDHQETAPNSHTPRF